MPLYLSEEETDEFIEFLLSEPIKDGLIEMLEEMEKDEDNIMVVTPQEEEIEMKIIQVDSKIKGE